MRPTRCTRGLRSKGEVIPAATSLHTHAKLTGRSATAYTSPSGQPLTTRTPASCCSWPFSSGIPSIRRHGDRIGVRSLRGKLGRVDLGRGVKQTRKLDYQVGNQGPVEVPDRSDPQSPVNQRAPP